MKYSQKYNNDFNWMLKQRHLFNFDGREHYRLEIQYDKNGVDGKKAFYLWESQGKSTPTKHPNLLQALLKTKGSINLHIKMYAEARASCDYNKIEFRAFCISIKAPDWFRTAVENQKLKYL